MTGNEEPRLPKAVAVIGDPTPEEWEYIGITLGPILRGEVDLDEMFEGVPEMEPDIVFRNLPDEPEQ